MSQNLQEKKSFLKRKRKSAFILVLIIFIFFLEFIVENITKVIYEYYLKTKIIEIFGFSLFDISISFLILIFIFTLFYSSKKDKNIKDKSLREYNVEEIDNQPLEEEGEIVVKTNELSIDKIEEKTEDNSEEVVENKLKVEVEVQEKEKSENLEENKEYQNIRRGAFRKKTYRLNIDSPLIRFKKIQKIIEKRKIIE